MYAECNSVEQQLPDALAPGTSFMGDSFLHGLEMVVWFQDDSSALHLLCTLFLHFGSSGIRSQRLGTPARERKLDVYRRNGVIFGVLTFDRQETVD